MKKKFLSLCLVMALSATAVIGGTLAYFTDNESAKNEFVVGEVDIVLDEEFDDLTPLLPGDHTDKDNHVDKIVKIGNDGKSDAYVRLLIAYEDTKDVGAMAFFDFNEPYGIKGVVGDEDKFVIPSSGNDWLQIKDTTTNTVYTVAYVTVSEALAQGKSVEIMQSLAIKAGADNDWAKIVGEKYDVLVLAQGSQVITDKTATESIDAAFGFKMDNAADDYVAKLFTKAGLGNFEKFDYTAEGAWTAEKATADTTAEWEAVNNHPAPGADQTDAVGTITKESEKSTEPTA